MSVDRIEARLAWDCGATLGEGPVWIDGALWFVDIKGGALLRHGPATGGNARHDIDGRPSFVLPADDGSLIVGSGDGLYRVADGAAPQRIADIAMPAHNRTNDATVDARGRLWFGTMDDGEKHPTGAVYVHDRGTVTRVGGDCVITNGPAISPDGATLYHVDTLARTIMAFDLRDRDDLVDGTVFATIARGDGNPDGVSVDAEGHVWVGLWGGWEARRYTPDGTLVARVALPSANVTKVAFGGPDLKTGFVTTARAGLDAAALADQPLAGGLFAFDAPAPGLPSHRVALA